MASAKLLLAIALSTTMLVAREIPFYVGTNSAPGKQNGILRCTLDLETGNLSVPAVAAAVAGPTFLATSPDGRFLYAALEQEGGEVAAYQILADHELAPLNIQPAGGQGTCHVYADQSHVIASNYTDGSATCFPVLPTGALGNATATITFSGSGPDPVRQKKSFAHAAIVTPEGHFAYVCDLGSDQIRILHFDRASGKLLPADPPSGLVPPGGGPRHLVLGAGGDFLYVNNEMGLSISVFKRSRETGALRLLQTIPTLPEGLPTEGATTSGLILHPNGRWLYVSNRGHNSLTVFQIHPDGQLTFVQNSPATVDCPREFSIDPSGTWLVVGGQKDGAIASMKINGSDGTLTPQNRVATEAIPVSFVFVP